MPIKVACQCGASFAAKDELAGKAVRCPKCKQPLKIPAPKAKVAPAATGAMNDLFDEAGINAQKGAVCPKCYAELMPNATMCVACGFDMQSGEHREGAKVRSVAEQGHGEGADTLLARAERQIEIDKEEDKKNLSQGAPAYTYLFGLVVITAFAGMMFTLPKGTAFFITGSALVGFAGLRVAYYQIRWFIVAFQEGLAPGFLHLVPLYSIYYLITRWDRVGVWFIAMLKIIPFYIFGGLLMGLGALLGFDYPDKDESRRPQESSVQVAYVLESDSNLSAYKPFES